MTRHVMDNHPDTVKAMEKMHNEDPKRNEIEVGRREGGIVAYLYFLRVSRAGRNLPMLKIPTLP